MNYYLLYFWSDSASLPPDGNDGWSYRLVKADTYIEAEIKLKNLFLMLN